MIRFIRGEYLYYESGAIVVETRGGIGFRIFISDTSSLLTAREGDEIAVYTYLQVKEDGMSLYGFADSEGLALFEQLITVKGVGPKAGLAIMSLGTPNQIKGVIAAGDAASISMAQGVGKKTAQRIALELKGKVSDDELKAILGEEAAAVSASAAVQPDYVNDALAALQQLGYTAQEANRAVASVRNQTGDATELLRLALRNMG